MALNKIGLLDNGLRDHNSINTSTPFESIISEAVIAEKLGFSRLWYTEHYIYDPNCVWLSPEIFLPVLAAYTSAIRIGIAGVQIMYRSPVQVAGNLKLINNIYQNRIDLGFAKGAPINGYSDFYEEFIISDPALRRQQTIQKIKSTIDILKNEEEMMKKLVVVPPVSGQIPDLWNLVSSPSGYQNSLDLGINCSRTLFFDQCSLAHGKEELADYRQKYLKKFGVIPQINVVVSGTCQKTDKAWKEILNMSLAKKDIVNDKTKVFGTPEKVFDQIHKIAEDYDVNEVIFLERSRHYKNRIQSFKNISNVFNLKDQKMALTQKIQ